MKKGIILVNAYIRSEGAFRQAERMKEELMRLGVQAEVEKNGNFLCSVKDGRIALSRQTDFCVYLDKDKYLPRMLEKCGVRLFNSAAAVEVCDDITAYLPETTETRRGLTVMENEFVTYGTARVIISQTTPDGNRASVSQIEIWKYRSGQF